MRRYVNPSGRLASVGDTQGFGPNGAYARTPPPAAAPPPEARRITSGDTSPVVVSIDGSSDVRVFFKICLPQVLAGLAATAVFGLILTWNEFLFALLLSGVETRTVPVAMSQTIGGDIGVRWGLLAAIETLFLIPVIIVTFALQNQLLRGVTFGTIKR